MAENLSTLSSDGLKGTPTGDGARYTTMSTWESTQQKDLVAAGDTEVLECYNDWPTGLSNNVNITGWTTGAGNGITIRAASGQGHGGVVGAGFWMRATGGGATCVTVDQTYVTVQDCEFQTIDRQAFRVNRPAGDNCLAERIITSSTGGTEASCRMLSNSSVLRNSLLINTSTGGISLECDRAANNSIDNCTSIAGNSLSNGTAITFQNSGSNFTGNIRNCVFAGTAAQLAFSGTIDSNAFITGSNTWGANQQTDISEADFVDYAGADYNPATGGKLDGTGTDLSGTFTDDITGGTRTQWDIGAYGIISAGDFADTNAFTITITSGVVTVDPDDLSQSQTLDNVTVTYTPADVTVNPAGVIQAQTIDNVTVTYTPAGVTVDPDDLSQSQTLDNVGFFEHSVLSTAGISQSQLFDNVTVALPGEIAVISLTQNQTLGNVTVSPFYSVTPEALSQNQFIANVTVSFDNQVGVSDIVQPQTLGTVDLTQAGELQVDSFAQTQGIDVVFFGGLIIGALSGEVTMYPYMTGDPVVYGN
jgi:hypothetical protein